MVSLLTLALGVTAVLAKGSAVETEGGRILLEQRDGIYFNTAQYLGHESNRSNFCQAHTQYNPPSLPPHQKNNLEDHNIEHICPKAPAELKEWVEGKGETWSHVPLCTYMPAFTNSSASASSQRKAPVSFCAFTATSFRSERGISLVTKPHIASQIAQLPAFDMHGMPHLHGSRPPPYEIKHVVGKGMGVIANRTIFRGERLFAHPAIGIFHNDIFLERRAKEYLLRMGLMEIAVEQLPGETKGRFHAMIGQSGAHNEVMGKLNVNTFGEDFGGEEHSIIIPETARMNHDCRPNAMYYFDPDTLVHYTQASRTINPGEEVTITYVDPLQSRKHRLDAIRRSWGFECACALCTSPKEMTDASDGRIETINTLLALLRKEKKRFGVNPSIRDEEPEMAELLVSLYEQERLTSNIFDAYDLAASAYRNVGKLWEALKWSYRAEEASLIHDGPREGGLKNRQEFNEDLIVRTGLAEEALEDEVWT